MHPMADLKGKRVVVVGLARSGVGAANILNRLGAQVTVNDRKQLNDAGPFLDSLESGITVELGGHPDGLFEKADLIVVSPGVPLTIPPIRAASEKGTRIISELELSYQIVETLNRAGKGCHTDFLAITGTNGKSTTTTLVYEMLKNSGFHTILAGNIGYALTEAIGAAGDELPELIAAEISSFQLEAIERFRPKVAAILNITPDHLDRYPSMGSYADAKCAVFSNQGAGDYLVLNADDPMTAGVLERIGRQESSGREIPLIFYFSMKDEVVGAYLKDGIVRFNLPEYESGPFSLDPAGFKIKGVHNIENAMAASLIALLSGCSVDAVVKTMDEFPGLEHRLEFVREAGGVRYINDSKGTNVGAVIKSLEGFNEPVVLIAGGRDKDSDFSLLAPFVRDRVKALVLIGEAADKIKKALAGCTEIFKEDSLTGAVLKAGSLASAGDVVLLSPACASFDMFMDFEDRGRQFKKAVMDI